MTFPLGSASQTSLHEECLRKYALRYVCNIDSPTTASQALGKDVDDNKLQPYLSKGTPIEIDTPAGQIAAAGLHLLPPPMYSGLEVQKGFEMPVPKKNFGWRGFIDLWLPNRGLPDFEDAPGIPIVVDFKTTKNWNWIKSADDLLVDPQAQIYAMYAMWATKAREVDLVWTYFRTTPPYKARRSSIRVNADHVVGQMEKLNEIGERMFALRVRAEGLTTAEAKFEFAMSLPPSPEACSNFGGCPHRHLCNLSPADFIGPDSTNAAPHRRLPIVSESIDLFANLAEDAGIDLKEVGVNPPEKTLPPAPAVGSVEADDDETEEEVEEKPTKTKRKRRTKAEIEADNAQIAKDTAEIRAAAPVETVAPATTEHAVERSVDFQVAWAELGAAVQRFFTKVGSP